MTADAAPAGLVLPPDRPFDVVGVGVNVVNELLVVERFPAPDTKSDAVAVVRQGGGVVATALVTCARHGLRAKYVGKVGADDFGAIARETLRREGIDVGDVVTDPHETTRYTVGLVEQATGRRTLIRAAMRPARLRAAEVPRAAVTAGRILHLDGYEGAAALQAARWAREAGIPISLDAEEATEDLDALVALTDVLIVSRRFGQRLTGASRPAAMLDALARLGPRLVGVTLGADGAAIRADGRALQAAGVRVSVADTTGAGDVFHGAFLAGLVRGWSLEESLRLANAVAAAKCTRLGGQAGIPTLDEARALARAS